MGSVGVVVLQSQGEREREKERGREKKCVGGTGGSDGGFEIYNSIKDKDTSKES